MSHINRRTALVSAATGASGLAAIVPVASTQARTHRVPTRRNKFHIFALMGQSNMAGNGELTEDDVRPRKNIVHLPTVTADPNIWRPSVHPLHNRLISDRFGLGLVFAERYVRENPGVTVGLLPLAWGGAGITKLHKGTPTYNDFLSRLAFAQPRGVFKGVLWHQGETDTFTETDTSQYADRLDQLIADIRSDANSPKLPFIVGNLSPRWDGAPQEQAYPGVTSRVPRIRASLRELPTRVPHTGWVSSDSCESFPKDPIHFNRAGLITLGRRYLRAYNKLTD
ncbi:sialate O-acetylesterase [Demetria terragena]|uniref:sialate O-acetylesterase n=1 Tax=Demetria terragena TaxID=63959 RepID=UPI0003810F43|nr:sialate O-acetylesterase [Demetria terragena]